MQATPTCHNGRARLLIGHETVTGTSQQRRLYVPMDSSELPTQPKVWAGRLTIIDTLKCR